MFREIAQHHFNVERMAAIFFCIINAGDVCAFSQSGRVTFTETDEGSRSRAERVICRFRGMQTVPMVACEIATSWRSLTDDESRTTAGVSGVRKLCMWLFAPQSMVTRIIRDISRCPHGPVVTKFYCPAPYFYLPRDVGTCLSLSPVEPFDSQPTGVVASVNEDYLFESKYSSLPITVGYTRQVWIQLLTSLMC